MGKMVVKGVTYGGGDCANQNLAPEFSESSTYAVDDYVIYQDDLYKCTIAVSTAGSWDDTKWTRANITDEMGGSSVSALEDLTDVDITNPAANDTIKWNPITLKWENGAGGGTGDVADVYVNGQSVLDTNKIAQITNYVELTQAEYNALPATKLTDNVLYCIKDQSTADTTVAPIIYSDEEREVGVWRDGKPLYQKTIYSAGGSIGTIDIAHGISNIDKVIFVEGTVHDHYGDDTTDYTLPRIPSDGAYIGIAGINKTNVSVFVNGAFGSSRVINFYITIRYTKTTDQPGSGKYAPSGVPAVHYSENEQVVGTWIDGSTLYEKTISGTITITSQNRTWYELISASDITNVLKVNKIWVANGSYLIDPQDGTVYNVPSSTGAGAAFVAAMKVDDGSFKAVLVNVSPGSAEYSITIQYTKTTS